MKYTCPVCSGTNTEHVKASNGDYYCKDCGHYFEVDESGFSDFTDIEEVK